MKIIYFPFFLVGSGFLTLGLIPIMIRISKRYNIVDSPDGTRKTQTFSIPKLGGSGVVITFSLTLGITALMFENPNNTTLLLKVLLPAILLAFVGLLDDLVPLSPWLRLFIQALCGIFAWFTETQFSITNIYWVDLFITVLWIVTLINAFNFIDNTDGLLASICAISAIGIIAISIAYGQVLVGSLSSTLAGVALGFLVFNWAPAKIYLGDSGSYFFGFMLAILALRTPPELDAPVYMLIIPMLLLAYPIIDLLYVIFGRIKRKIHPFTPGKDHTSHVLLTKTKNVSRVVIHIQIIHTIFVIMAIIIAVMLK